MQAVSLKLQELAQQSKQVHEWRLYLLKCKNWPSKGKQVHEWRLYPSKVQELAQQGKQVHFNNTFHTTKVQDTY